ncbi:dihydrolipoyl dehydrogenase [Mycolicibacterium sp.]|uniref:dihydrolipoyl dehydrogenase n=1 Tax=Mycolicibacterium sp. TaxID=2320850 RepID=UPI0037CBC3C1
MVVGEMADRVDLLVVGGGPGGYTAAKHAATLGASVLLVDSAGTQGLGGSCLHVGCIPSKALIEVAGARRRVPEFGRLGIFTDAAEPEVDMGAFQSWKGEFVEQLTGQIATAMKQARVVVQEGTVRLSSTHRAVIQNDSGTPRFVEFDRAIIATGSRPATLPGLEVDQRRILDSTGLLALTTVPRSIVVVGAGYIGIELGTALAKLGAKVTMVEAGDRVLPGVPKAAIKPVLKRLAQLGVSVLTASQVRNVDDTGVNVVCAENDLRHLAAEMVGVTVGRVPNTDELGLASADVAVGARGLIDVDASCRARPHIAAVGDVTPGPALAHRAIAQARVAAEALCGKDTHFDAMAIPAVVFSDPEVAYVGLTAEDGIAQGIEVRTVSFPIKASGRARTLNETSGSTTLTVESGTDRILGAQIVGPHASEIIGHCALAIEMDATATDLALTILPHPTMSETVMDAAAAYAG